MSFILSLSAFCFEETVYMQLKHYTLNKQPVLAFHI